MISLPPSVQAYQGTALCTIKLHYAMHHVPVIMASHGFLHKFQELWIERMVADVKDSIHGNAKQRVENTYVHVELCRRAATESRSACNLMSTYSLSEWHFHTLSYRQRPMMLQEQTSRSLPDDR